MSRLAKLVAAFAAVSIATPSSAAVRTFDFVARIDQQDGVYPAGTMINGSFSYDDALTPTSTYSYDPENGYLYRAEGAEYISPDIRLSFTLDGTHYSDGGRASIFDMIDEGQDESDRFYIHSQNNPQRSFGLLFQSGSSVTMFVDTRLPASFPATLWQGPFTGDDDGFDPTDVFPHAELEFWDGERREGLTALVLSITPAGISAVPEPSTWAMMIAGFGAIGAALRHRARPSRRPVLN